MKKTNHSPRDRVYISPYCAQTKIVTSVKVKGEPKPNPAFYVRRDKLFDQRGRLCLTPLELGQQLALAIERRDAESVAGCCWDALNFVHNGAVPKNWLGEWKKHGPTPLAI